MSLLIDEGLVTASKDIPNMPVGRSVFIQTSAELSLAWFDPNTGTFGATQTISTPGEEVSVPSYKARITTATTANIRIALQH
jgi:hypothetical protein